VFNHKGGVGKTTITMNLAGALAELGRTVLIVDSDPQCNSTSYLIADDVVDDLLDKSDTENGQTVWSAMSPISEGTGGLKMIEPIESGIEGVFILPGDIRLSEFETDLAEFWGQALQRRIRGFRGTAALSELVNTVTERINADYVLYDSGPNIGPLNRAILLDCDGLIVPVACDLFSLRALKTLGRTLVDWIEGWATISALAPADTYLLPGRPRFLGYVPGGFRVYGGEIAGGPARYLARIEKEVYAQVIALLRKTDLALAEGRLQDFKLGEIKHFGTLVQASQNEGLPLWDVSDGTPTQRNQAHRAFAALAKKVEARVET
jgi:cellulose biosynthesis protein BcsQ